MSEITNIHVKEAEFDEIPEFARLICQGFNDKFPIIFKGLSDKEYIKVMADIISSVYNEMLFRGNYVANFDGKICGALKLLYKDAGAEPWKKPWHILKEKLGFWKGLRSGFLLEKLISSKIPKDALYIDAISVDSNYRSKGIGTKMLQFAESLAKDLNFGYLTLTVIGKNTRAKTLYEQFGFEVVGYKKFWLGKRLLDIPDYYEMKKKIIKT